MTLQEKVGARLVFGIPGTTATPEDIALFKETHAGGLMLYRTNFESPDQLRKLISDLESALGRRLLVCTDHEGGRVIMFGQGTTIFPSQQALGKTGNTSLARGQGEQEGRELRRLGIDVNFAPVLDVLTPAYSPNIGIRSFGSDADLVAKMGAARISAMQVEGLSACAKHFPGLGAATLDPHLNLPTIDLTWDEMEHIHLLPFSRAMRTNVHSIMTSHPLYPQLDPTPNTPATFSRVIVHDYLRQKVGYKGVIFSDDLEMGALTNLCTIGDAAVQTAQAGHDMLLVCHKADAQRAVYAALCKAYETHRLDSKEMDDSLRRIDKLKAFRTERFAALPATPARAERERQEAQTLVQEISRAATTISGDGPALLPSASTAVIFPRLSSLADRILIEPSFHNEASGLLGLLSTSGFSSATVHIIDIEPSAAQIEATRTASAGADQTLLFLYDAHMYPSNKALLDVLQQSAKRLVVVLLRDAYDASYVTAQHRCITNYGFRQTDIEAAVRASLQTPSHVA